VRHGAQPDSDDDQAGYEPRWISFNHALIPAVELAAHAYVLRGQCESPIEVMLGAQLCAMGGDLNVIPQFPLDGFRYDFAIYATGQPGTVVLIECDGKDYHSTPEQIANDERKDAAASRVGMGIVRFTGSDINADARHCARVAVATLTDRVRRA
jgi:very-short-patch-repair endonuclease